jgi:hypothetical protein
MRFRKNIFLQVNCLPHTQPPTWKIRISLFAWVITFDLSAIGDPTSSYTTTSIARRTVWPYLSHQSVKVGIPLRSYFSIILYKISWIKLKGCDVVYVMIGEAVVVWAWPCVPTLQMVFRPAKLPVGPWEFYLGLFDPSLKNCMPAIYYWGQKDMKLTLYHSDPSHLASAHTHTYIHTYIHTYMHIHLTEPVSVIKTVEYETSQSI